MPNTSQPLRIQPGIQLTPENYTSLIHEPNNPQGPQNTSNNRDHFVRPEQAQSKNPTLPQATINRLWQK